MYLNYEGNNLGKSRLEHILKTRHAERKFAYAGRCNTNDFKKLMDLVGAI